MLGADKLYVDGAAAGVDAVVAIEADMLSNTIRIFRRRRDTQKIVFLTVEG